MNSAFTAVTDKAGGFQYSAAAGLGMEFRLSEVLGLYADPSVRYYFHGDDPEKWAEIKHATVQGGSNIIKLRGRSSFQSPAYQAVKMIEAAMGGAKFTWPAGCYVNAPELGYCNVMMAMPTVIDADGVHYTAPNGTPTEMADLKASYEHLCKMRDEIVSLGIVPPVADWKKENPNL